jgi:Fic family protein
MTNAEEYLRRYSASVTPYGVTLLCPEDQVERLEARNQERLSQYVFGFWDTYSGRDPFRISVILEMHAITVSDIYPSAGRFRTTSEGVRVPGSGFTPSPPHLIENHIRDLLSRVARVAKSPGWSRWLAYAALALHRFLRIHPFLGGSGRIGRAFHLMMLYEFGLLRSPEQVFDFFKRYRSEYLESLREADTGNIHRWISLNRTAVLDWHHQRLYDQIRRDRRLRLHILPQINRSERQLMSRERRLTLELEANIRRSRQLHQQFKQLMSREYQLTLELGE